MTAQCAQPSSVTKRAARIRPDCDMSRVPYEVSTEFALLERLSELTKPR
jgi:hypothetical protein